MNKELNIATVGAGVIAPFHFHAMKSVNNANVVAICDIDESKATKFAQENKIEYSTNLDDLLNNPDIDVIDVTVPSGYHADIGIAAARAGKHVIVEKPIDVTLEKADQLINTCKENGVTLMVISQNRFLNSVMTVAKAVANKELGTLVQGSAYIKWYRSQEYYNSGAWRGTVELDGGGCLMNQGIHFIDLLLSMMGPVKSVTAKTKIIDHDIQVEDIAMALLEFESGAFGVIEGSTSGYPGLPARLEICGNKGTAIVEGERLALLHVDGKDPIKDPEQEKVGGAATPTNIDLSPFIRQFTDFVDAVHNKRDPIISGIVARRPLQLILAIYESSRTGKPVSLS